MLTNVATTVDMSRRADATTAAAQKVVIVNGSSQILELLETVLDAGRYDVVFVESSQHAYSQIKRVQPNLVILCVHVDDPSGFQVLSMLKLDPDTSEIPILTYTTEYEAEQEEDEPTETADTEIFAGKPAVWMN